MTKKIDKQDNEVYILGTENNEQKNKLSKKAKIILLISCFIVLGIVAFSLLKPKEDVVPEYYFEPEQVNASISVSINDSIDDKSVNKKGYIEVASDTINDVPLLVYTPHEANLSLQVGLPSKNDSTIVFAAMAADIRKDNNQIVGDFVLSGKVLAKGIAKKGYCAIVNNTITIGMGDQTPLLQQTMDSSGYFFRQYPLVINGLLIENKPKNKSIRRAIGVRNGEIIMIQSQNNESFHDFSQALIDIGLSDAIYLVGGNAFGWYNDKDSVHFEHGKEDPNLPETITYIVWRANQ